jgi:aminoglycoside phosphotransferase (APT) family kinase protein
VIPARVVAWVRQHCDGAITSLEPVGGGRTDTIWSVRSRGTEPLILRYVEIESWGEIGRRHIVSEASGCRLMAGSALPVPRLVATDPDGRASGAYVNLTTWLPGQVRLDPLSEEAIGELARVAVVIHDTPVAAGERPQPYAFWTPPHLAVPGWARRPDLWQQAIDRFAAGPPATPHGLVHRDFHPGNVLWQGDQITGVIDWAETSWGPADLDVVHSCTNFAMLHDVASATAFLAAYRRHGGQLERDPEAARFWAVSDILGFLPDPDPVVRALTAARPDLTPDLLRTRLEELLELTLAA